MKNIQANNNRAKGNCYRHETCFGAGVDETAGNATLENVTANRNGADGNCSGDDVCFGIAADGVEGKVTINWVEATYNGAKGHCVTASGTSGAPQYGPIPLNDSCNGIITDGEDWSLGTSINGALASHNGAFSDDWRIRRNCGDNGAGTTDSCMGLIFDGRGGDIVLWDVEANDNGATGDCQGNDMCAGILNDPSDVVGKFYLTNVQANRNGAGQDCLGRDSCFGILHDTGFCSGNVMLCSVEASDNGAGRNCPADDSCQGIVIDSGDNTGNFKFTDVAANGNGAGQDCGANDNCNGILIDGGGIDPIECDDPSDPSTCDFEDLVSYCPLFGPGPFYLPIDTFFVSLTGIEANSNGAGRDCSSADDQCSGTIVDGVRGDLTMKNVTANDNKAVRDCLGPDSCNGVLADTEDGFAVRLEDVDAEGNGAGGVCPQASSCNDVLSD